MKILNDVSAENAILAGLIKYSNDAYIDVSGIINEDSFVHGHNSTIYKCIKKLLEEDPKRKIDIPSIYSSAKELGLEFVFKKTEQVNHLNSLLTLPVNKSNLEKFAKKLRKFEVARLQIEQLKEAQDKLYTLTGDETISQILSIPEDAIFNFQARLNSDDTGPALIFNDVLTYVDKLSKNPKDQIGISSGLKHWDAAIGGGLRPGTVNLIGARLKVGKSIVAQTIATYISKELKVPTLYLDTEMGASDATNRILSMMSGIVLKEIETGKFSKNTYWNGQVQKAAKTIQNIPYYYKSIAGMSHEDQVGTMRRWVIKNVGLNQDGTSKPCVIIHDYLKLMDSHDLKGDMKEYQLLGFHMTNLHNFAVKYQLPIVSFIQLNRDALNKDDLSTVSQSDRVSWLASNISLLKEKSDEEIAEDGLMLGNRKLIPLACRHGPGLHFGEYICLNFRGDIMSLKELGLNTTLRKQNKQAPQSETDDNSEF